VNGNLQLGANALLEAFSQNRSVELINRSLIRMMLKGQQKDFALYLVARLYSGAHSEAGRAALKELQTSIENGTVDIASLEVVD
jgi:hypothetical protein